jgi:hypothetical protein
MWVLEKALGMINMQVGTENSIVYTVGQFVRELLHFGVEEHDYPADD